MAKIPLRRRNTVEIVRTDVLKITQREVGEILGFKTTKSVYEMERADEDRITLDQLRQLRAYAIANGIKWPANLIVRLFNNDPSVMVRIPKNNPGRPPGTH